MAIADSQSTHEHASTAPRTVKGLIEEMPDDLIRLLAALDHLNPDIARGAVSGLPTGTRYWLSAAGVLEKPKDERVLWSISKHGREVIAACAATETVRDQEWLRERAEDDDGVHFSELSPDQLPRPA